MMITSDIINSITLTTLMKGNYTSHHSHKESDRGVQGLMPSRALPIDEEFQEDDEY